MSDPLDADAAVPSRRKFAQQVALLASAPLALKGEAQAQFGADPAAEALFAMIQQRYAKFLTPAQLDAVKRGVARNVAIAGMLHEVKLQNSDEPAFAFRADLP
ncbi:hypothetical protein AYO44_12705 [Planctomycetaceae bacterium SCGC AG-212-F19]|nr:hypothetical protein AYO44_12705 [Planctomycetaceae bacterium SCGC AG-212-F19]